MELGVQKKSINVMWVVTSAVEAAKLVYTGMDFLVG